MRHSLAHNLTNSTQQARALRQEREKLAIARKENSIQRQQQQVRLSYDPNDKAFVLGGDQDEIQRILSDLSKLSQLHNQSNEPYGFGTPCHTPVNVQGTRSPLHSINQQQWSIKNSIMNNTDGGTKKIPMNNDGNPPMPSPQPSRPPIEVVTGSGSNAASTFSTPSRQQISHYATANGNNAVQFDASGGDDFDQLLRV